MNPDDVRQQEAQRIINRMNAETDGAAMAAVKRRARKGRDHFAASDADRDDWAELWGTRIGRAIAGILIFCVLTYFAAFVLAG